MHVDMCATCVNAVLTSPGGFEGVNAEDLTYAWRYGYYLRACEMSLSDQGRSALA